MWKVEKVKRSSTKLKWRPGSLKVRNINKKEDDQSWINEEFQRGYQ